MYAILQGRNWKAYLKRPKTNGRRKWNDTWCGGW